jgi:TRAP-type C4-dicarboxylate transport system substrate-binding protein
MKRALFLGLLILALVTLPLLAACETTPTPTTTQPPATATQITPPTTTQPAQVFTLKWSGVGLITEPSTITAYRFLDLVEQKSGGRVQFERFPGGVLGTTAEQLNLAKSGSVDMATIAMLLVNLPLTHFPIWGSGTDADRLSIAYKVMFENAETANLIQQANEENDVKILFLNASTPAGVITKFPANALSDFQGKKIGAPTVQEPLVQSGATMITLLPPDMYEGLARGLVDGVFINVGIMVGLKLYEQAKYLLVTEPWTTAPGYPIAVNMNSWNKLPSDIQAIFTAAGQEVKESSIQGVADELAGYLKTMTDAGITVAKLSEADSNTWTSFQYPITAQNFINDCTKAGKAAEADIILKYCDEIAKQVSGRSTVR